MRLVFFGSKSDSLQKKSFDLDFERKDGFGEKITGDLREDNNLDREWSAENNINRDD